LELVNIGWSETEILPRERSGLKAGVSGGQKACHTI
jgi:hypothetical protein